MRGARRWFVCSAWPERNSDQSTNPFDQSNSVNCSSDMNFAVDRLPLEATVGWDATLNGNLAEQLIEPTLLGAFEGAGITVLAKGVDFHGRIPGTMAQSQPPSRQQPHY